MFRLILIPWGKIGVVLLVRLLHVCVKSKPATTPYYCRATG